MCRNAQFGLMFLNDRKLWSLEFDELRSDEDVMSGYFNALNESGDI